MIITRIVRILLLRGFTFNLGVSASGFFLFLIVVRTRITIWTIVIYKHHVLILLLFIEVIMLSILIIITFRLKPIRSVFFIIYFTLAVCEARVGLGLLIQIARQIERFILHVVFLRFKLIQTVSLQSWNCLRYLV